MSSFLLFKFLLFLISTLVIILYRNLTNRKATHRSNKKRWDNCQIQDDTLALSLMTPAPILGTYFQEGLWGTEDSCQLFLVFWSFCGSGQRCQVRLRVRGAWYLTPYQTFCRLTLVLGMMMMKPYLEGKERLFRTMWLTSSLLTTLDRAFIVRNI